MAGIICIEREKLKQLLISSAKLEALETGGVDNWSFYGEAMNQYLSELEDLSPYKKKYGSFEEVGEVLLERFEKHI